MVYLFIIFPFTALNTKLDYIITKDYYPKKQSLCLEKGRVHLWLVTFVQHASDNLKQQITS